MHTLLTVDLPRSTQRPPVNAVVALCAQRSPAPRPLAITEGLTDDAAADLLRFLPRTAAWGVTGTPHGPVSHRAHRSLPRLLLAVPREIRDAAVHLFGGQLR